MTTQAGHRIDWKAERDRIDLASVATGLLGPATGRRGERGAKLWWLCPFHEDRNPSFCVEPGKAWWKCFGCDEHGDAASLVMRLEKVSFPEALAYLTGRASPSGKPGPVTTPQPRRSPHPAPRTSGLPERNALALVTDAQRRLLAPEGADALAYLTGPQRGLTIETIKAARLGWAPDVRVPRKGGDGTYTASGIVIPWFDRDRLTLVKIRQPDGRRPKYAEVHRGERFTGIYPDRWTVRPGRPLIIVEGEFDALLLGQELGDLGAVVTLGSASNRPSPGILGVMLAACPWFVATDADGAGDQAAVNWPASARRIRPPALQPHPRDLEAKASTDWCELVEAKASTDWCELAGFGVDLRRWWSDRLTGVENPTLFSWEELADWRW